MFPDCSSNSVQYGALDSEAVSNTAFWLQFDSIIWKEYTNINQYSFNMNDKIKMTSEFLKTIADINRFKILVFLKNKPQCVCKIFPMLRISQKLASHHLSQLKKIGLVEQERNGNFIYYSINKKALKKYLKTLNLIIK